ncbi:MAG: hypothetical protein COA65_09780 [Rhodospirillaceae bacterium]|nr:MAG: hypothetical protein COA65_09780 [Rhodospirillaceae bacterium]
MNATAKKTKEIIERIRGKGIGITGGRDYNRVYEEFYTLLSKIDELEIHYAHQSTSLPLSDKEIGKGVEKIFFKKVGAMWMNLARSEMIDLMIKSAKWTRDQHTPNTAESERIKELETLINSPEINDFLEGVKLESAHQTERHNRKLEENKYPHDYALVLDKLKGKQALSIWDKNTEKYKHHLITMAAVCFNVHRQVDKKLTAINEWFNPSPPNK